MIRPDILAIIALLRNSAMMGARPLLWIGIVAGGSFF